MSTLQSKTIVVVGGSSGIGFAVALAALQSLASVVIIASSNSERVSSAVERLRSHKLPGEVRGEVLDATDPVSVKEFALHIGTVDHIAWTSGDVSPGLVDGDLSKLDTSGALPFTHHEQGVQSTNFISIVDSGVRRPILGPFHTRAKCKIPSRRVVDTHVR